MFHKLSKVPGRVGPFAAAVALAGGALYIDHSGAGALAPALETLRAQPAGEWLLGADQPSLWLIAVSIALAALAAIRAFPERHGTRMARIGALAVGGAASVLALLSLRSLAMTQRLHNVPGVGQVWSLDDDMMITLRYSANLASGDGLVWNQGEQVEGITNMLWAIVLALPHLFMERGSVALAAIALNGALLAMAITLTFLLVTKLGGSLGAAMLASLALATDQATLHWAAGGSEMILLATLLLFVANNATGCSEPSKGGRRLAWACLAGGLATLTRPDAAPSVVALLAFPLWQRVASPHLRANGFWLIALLSSVPLAALLFRLAYYHAPLPNTYYLKMTGWSGRWHNGIDYALRWLPQHALPLLLAFAALLGEKRRSALTLLATMLLHLGYVVNTGGDELPKQRFFVPITPLLLAMAFVGIEEVGCRCSAALRATTNCTPLALPVSVLALLGIGGAYLPGVSDPIGERRAEADRANVMLGLLIHANTQSDARVAHFWAGATAYFSRRFGIDMFGKCDLTIARQQAKPGLTMPGHNKYDFDHSLALAPDVIVGGLGGMMTSQQIIDYARQSPYRAFGDLYRARGFTNYTLAMPLLAGNRGAVMPNEYVFLNRRYHALFVRVGTTRTKLPGEWGNPTPADLN